MLQKTCKKSDFALKCKLFHSVRLFSSPTECMMSTLCRGERIIKVWVCVKRRSAFSVTYDSRRQGNIRSVCLDCYQISSSCLMRRRPDSDPVISVFICVFLLTHSCSQMPLMRLERTKMGIWSLEPRSINPVFHMRF